VKGLHNPICFLFQVVTLTKLPSGNSQIFTTGNNRTLNGKDENKCSIKSLETTSTNQELGCDVTTNWEEDNPFLSSDVILDIPPYHNKNLSASTRPSGAEESTKKTKPKFPGPAGYLSTNSKVKTLYYEIKCFLIFKLLSF